MNGPPVAGKALDLAAEDKAVSEVAGPIAKAYDPAEHRDSTRARIAYGLIGILALVVVVTLFIAHQHTRSIADVKDVLVILFAPVVGLVGSALGFYFGRESRRED